MSKRLGLHKMLEGQGKLLADWLNQCAPGGQTTDPVAFMVGLLLRMESGEKMGGPTIEEPWPSFLKMLLGPDAQLAGIPPGEGFLRLKASEYGCDFHILVGIERGKLHLDVVPLKQKGEALIAFKVLTNLGQANRVRLCPNCQRWFFAQRVDSKLCSPSCQVSAWRKSEAGHKARAAYMREYRGTRRRIWEKQQKGKLLKTGVVRG